MSKVKIKNLETHGVDSKHKDEYIRKTVKLLPKLFEQQRRLIASKTHGVLIVLQGLDASGKDGIIKSIIGAFSPVGCRVHTFKKPSEEEYAHDYLWRIHSKLPAHGEVVVFDRSYYEDILVPSVLGYIDPKIVKHRYDQINSFEEYLIANNIHIIKIFLNVSKEVEQERLTERVTNPEKYRKHEDGDWATFDLREKYLAVYEKIFEKCNNPKWHYIPADANWIKNYYFAKVLVEELEKLELDFPDLDTDRDADDYRSRIGDEELLEALREKDLKEIHKIHKTAEKIVKKSQK